MGILFFLLASKSCLHSEVCSQDKQNCYISSKTSPFTTAWFFTSRFSLFAFQKHIKVIKSSCSCMFLVLSISCDTICYINTPYWVHLTSFPQQPRSQFPDWTLSFASFLAVLNYVLCTLIFNPPLCTLLYILYIFTTSSSESAFDASRDHGCLQHIFQGGGGILIHTWIVSGIKHTNTFDPLEITG